MDAMEVYQACDPWSSRRAGTDSQDLLLAFTLRQVARFVTAREYPPDMGGRRFDADNDKGRPDLGTLRVRELVDRVSG
jgi:hypothetical protein